MTEVEEKVCDLPEDAPETSISSDTPAGIQVYYQLAPKRLYKVKGVEEWQGWVEVPSVTTVLDVLDKPGLPWWGMKTGVDGIKQLIEMQAVVAGEGGLFTYDGASYVRVGTDELVALLTKHQLTVNHIRDKAGDRGTAVHDALEVWADTGTLPDPLMFPVEQQGYVLGLRRFLEHVDPEPEASEIGVGSVEHGYAGRYDLRISVKEAKSVSFHTTPKRGMQFARLEPGKILLDLKTSSGVYDSHSRQLEAYEQASIECGYEPTSARGILRLLPDGNYEFVRSTATFEDFKVVLGVWQSNAAMKARKK